MAMQENPKLSTGAEICVNNQERKRENFVEVSEDNAYTRMSWMWYVSRLTLDSCSPYVIKETNDKILNKYENI